MDELKYITFDKYLQDELTEVEKKSFEAQLLNDAEFKKDFEIYKALEASLSSKFENEEAEIELRKTLTNLGSEHIKNDETTKKETKVISLFNYKKLMIAASIALLIGFFMFKDGNPVYSDFANHGNLEIVVRSENSEEILNAENAFNSQKYFEALQELKILSDLNPDDVELQLYKAICHLELNSYTDADRIFDEISKGESSLATKATWYKALSFLKQEKLKECKEALQIIPESAEEYPQAKKLLKKL